MIRFAWMISLVLMPFLAVHASAQEGRLQQVRDDARSSSDANSGGGSNNDSVLGSLLGATDCDGNSIGGMALAYAVIAPFYLPAALLGDEHRLTLFFAPFPYANDYHGYQLLSPELAGMLYEMDTGDVPRRNWAGRVSIENGNDFDGLNRFNGQLRFEHVSRWGILTNWNWFRERLGNGSNDNTVIGDTNLTYRFAQNELASFYTGLGFRVLTDRKQSDFGFNFTYGGDWFPIQPIVVSASLDLGTLGNTGVVHARGTIGAIYHGCEFFAGYDFLQIGSTNLQGPTAGVRFWF